MPEIPTIEVENPDGSGSMVINASDFNPKVHTKWASKPAAKRPRKVKGATAADADPTAERIAELEALYSEAGWQAIKEIADPLGIEKPDEGWKAAIPLIVERESEQPN